VSAYLISSRPDIPRQIITSLILARNIADLDYCADRKARFDGVTDLDLNDDWQVLDRIAGLIAILARKIADAHRAASFIEPGPKKEDLIEQLCDIADDAFDPAAGGLVRAQARLDGSD